MEEKRVCVVFENATTRVEASGERDNKALRRREVVQNVWMAADGFEQRIRHRKILHDLYAKLD